MWRLVIIVSLAWISLLWRPLAQAQTESGPTVITLGYLELANDPRYVEEQMEARFQAQPWGRPYPGAKQALKEIRFAAAAANVKIDLRRYGAKDQADLDQTLKSWMDEGIHFVLLDLPGNAVSALTRQAAGQDTLLFNLSSRDPSLRQQSCASALLHVIPDQSMLMDGLAQYLISKKWREVLVLKGPSEDDAQQYAAFERSARRFGLKIVETRPFKLGRDPRNRTRNNIALLTSGEDYDVVFVADTQGEFARSVPYQIQQPRPVVGGAGLVSEGWSWAWARYGAPQLNKRFLRKIKRRMTEFDWAAWIAVKIIGEAVLRTGSSEFTELERYIKGDDIVIDGFKGVPLSFQDWNGQLRQPVFLTTTNWVIATAPLAGFLNRSNNLDTIGLDATETQCEMK